MVIFGFDGLQQINCKDPNRMSTNKVMLTVTRVLIQKWTNTLDALGEEKVSTGPAIDPSDCALLSTMHRHLPGKTWDGNLDSPGRGFQFLAFVQSCIILDLSRKPDTEPNRFSPYSVAARLALAASARGLADATHTGEA